MRAKPHRTRRCSAPCTRGNTCTGHGWAEGDGASVKVTIKRTGVSPTCMSMQWAESLYRPARLDEFEARHAE
ncbi:hypothetical protein GCM10010307_72310 [Streptomyces vastus]|uniref:Uncharacterized protein n=1 Tax=Streptomyces vastus TaxID=285451 RepID=A0ABP6E5L4_9ACTN